MAIGVAYAAVQVLLVAHVPLGWDETVYVDQVDPRVPAAFFSAPRARGISWLVAPVVAVTPSLPALRVYLALLSSAALVLAFGVWLRIRNEASVPVAAGIFATLWPSIFYGPAVMPNIWEAFAAVTATGCFLRWTAGEPGPLAPTGLATAIAVAALVRPSDSLFLVAPMAAAALLVPSWRRPQVFIVLAAAAAVGWAPWIVEAYATYGGPLARLQRGAQIQGGTTPRFAADLPLRAMDGPLLCRPCPRSAHPIPRGGILWLLATTAGSATALWQARRARPLAPTVVPLAVAASVAFPYLFLIGYAAPRFLLPAWSLVSLLTGEAVLVAWRGWRAAGGGTEPTTLALAARSAAVGVLALHLSTQVTVLKGPVLSSGGSQRNYAQLVSALRAIGVHPPCVLAGEQAPPIAFYAGCASRQPTGHDASLTPQQLTGLAAGEPVVLLERGPRPPWAHSWRRVPLPVPAESKWVAYLPPGTPAPPASSRGCRDTCHPLAAREAQAP